GVVRVLPAPEDRQVGTTADPHRAWRRVRAAVAARRRTVKLRTVRPPRLRRWREWTLRTRMVVSIAALAAVGLVCADAAGVTLLRSYLVHRVDAQLTATAPRRGYPGEFTGRARGFPSFGPQSRYYHYRDDGVRDFTADASETTGPELGSYKEIAKHAAAQRPYTVDGSDGPWRVYVVPSTGGGYTVSAVSLRELTGTEDSLLLI